MSKRYIDKWK